MAEAESVTRPERERMNERLRAVAAQVKQVRSAVVVEGEDATSAFATARWTAPDGTLLKIRWAWNGGCCQAPQIHEFVFAGDDLMREVVLEAPRDEGPALLRGGEPRRPVAREEVLFERGRMVLWAGPPGRDVDPRRDPERWREREARSLELVRSLRRQGD
jgi:hypothetical protein